MRMMMARDRRPWSSNEGLLHPPSQAPRPLKPTTSPQGPRLGVADLTGRLFSAGLASPSFLEGCASSLLDRFEALEDRTCRSYPAGYVITALCELFESGGEGISLLSTNVHSAQASHLVTRLRKMIPPDQDQEAMPANLRERLAWILPALEGNPAKGPSPVLLRGATRGAPEAAAAPFITY